MKFDNTIHSSVFRGPHNTKSRCKILMENKQLKSDWI